ncbi:hypothetical protein D3C77_611480 [compost metagenome]
MQRFVGKQVEVGQRRVHDRQTPGALTRTQKQHSTEQQHTTQRRRHTQGVGNRQAMAGFQTDGEQQQQTAKHATQDRVPVLVRRFLDETAGVNQ